jgi:fucose permease
MKSSAHEIADTIMELSQRQQQAESSIEAPPVIPEHAVETEPTSPPPKQLLKLLSAGFSFFVAGANDGCLGALIPYMLTTYSIPPSFISFLYLATFFGWFLAALANSHAPKYLQLGALLSIGAILQLLSQVLRAWKPPFGLFAVTFFFTGLGQAFQDSFSNTFVSSVKGAHRWLGFVHAMYGFGLLVSPFVATAIAGNGERRWELFYLFPLGLSVMNLGLVMVSFWDSVGIVRRSEVDEGETGRNKNAWKEMRQMLKMKDLWVLSLFFFFFLGVGTTSGGIHISLFSRQPANSTFHRLGCRILGENSPR